MASAATYTARLSIPKNTLERSPVEVTVGPMENTLTFWSVTFPKGCQNAVGIAIYYGGVRLVPAMGSADPWIRGDSTSESWSGEIKLETLEPFRIRGFSEGTLYPHNILIRLDCAQT